MRDYEPAMSFDAETAARYADLVRGDEADAVAFLAPLAQGGASLELAIGTGRIALPLAARGITVDGIDFSQAMVDVLRRRAGGDRLSVTVGDFADVAVPGRYRLVYIVFNTLFNLLTQDAQVRCFQNVAAHLDDGGSFVVEAFVPSWLHRLRDHQYVEAESIAARSVMLDVGRHDPVAQMLDESHVEFAGGRVRLAPIACRYAWPSELDLMARIAGLRLSGRWADWRRTPLTADSRNCVSVYTR
jgi:SAM-dependent methyltransferase